MSGAKKKFQQWDLFHLMEEMPEERHFRKYEVFPYTRTVSFPKTHRE
ncbi:hypothetical protein Lser_V15G14217 [Lactuca serriola]